MSSYKKTDSNLWSGRKSDKMLYLHEKILCIDLEKKELKSSAEKAFAILGYACDEGVKRNLGRIGAAQGSEAIRNAFAKMPNHLPDETKILDIGTICCLDNNMEAAQNELSKKVANLLSNNTFPVLLGGGHDIAYGHYKGLKKHFGAKKTIGIINFDAHFDLRSNKNGNNSGTPFFQIGQECKAENKSFNYLAVGIRKDANDKELFKTAAELGVTYIENKNFNLCELTQIEQTLLKFLNQVDLVYITIDLDGFSSAFAPGASAPSPMGFFPDIVLKCLQYLVDSKKVISFDIAEMNPDFDKDGQTAKLAASLMHYAIHRL